MGMCKDCKHYENGDCVFNGERWTVYESDTCEHFSGKSSQSGDMVNHPAHYTQGGIECIDALKAATVNLKGIEAVCTANAIKYLWRWKEKNGTEDLKKSIWYIERLIKECEK